MNRPTGIILLEGADASGKTTLARRLVERFGARYLHSTVRREIWRYHLGALRCAVRSSHDQLVVLDRHWLSELTYGEVFRGGPAYDVGARCLDRVLRRHGALTVLCVPTDLNAQAERWAAGRIAGKHEHFDQVREVAALYADLWHGNIARPNAGYLGQLTRFGDYAQRDDVLRYDLDVDGRCLDWFVDHALAHLRRLRVGTVPDRGENLTGRLGARGGTLLVGEALAPVTDRWPVNWPRWPFFYDERRLGAATWLNRALHHLAVNEEGIILTNAVPRPGDHDYLPELLADDRYRTVVTLGVVAHRRLHELGRPAKLVPHPSWHKRFRYQDGPEGYAETYLREAMR